MEKEKGTKGVFMFDMAERAKTVSRYGAIMNRLMRISGR